MKLCALLAPVALVSCAYAAALEPRADCNADNCLRAVRGRLPSASSDCNSYFAQTTTTTTTTSVTTKRTLGTTTITSTSYSVVGGSLITPGPDPPPYQQAFKRAARDLDAVAAAEEFAKRDTPKTIPTYASSCSGAVRYSSACSCVGATGTTATVTTVATTTFTSTTYRVTSTATSTVGVCDAAQNYGLQFDSVTVYNPPGNTEEHYYVSVPASSALDCCTTCASSKGCVFYEYFVQDDGTPNCSFHTYGGGAIFSPNNAICPFGKSGLVGPAGSILGRGPCNYS